MITLKQLQAESEQRLKDMDRRNRYSFEKRSAYSPWKIQCVICWWWFHRPCPHAYNFHWITAKDYKKMAGLDNKKWVTSVESKKKSREAVFNNPKCITQNLIKWGFNTRFKKWGKWIWVYKRSEQTMRRLKKLTN